MKAKVLHVTQRFVTHELITGSFFIFLGTIAASACNLILNLFLTRSFTPADYGIYAAVASMVALFTVPAQSISSAIIRFATMYLQKDDLSQAKKLFIHVSVTIGILGLLIIAIFIVFSSWFVTFLQLKEFIYVILGGLIIAFSYFSIVNNGFLQSLLKFKYLSFLSGLASVLRLLFAIALLFAGLHVTGVLIGNVAATLVVFLLTFPPLFFIFKAKQSRAAVIHVQEIISYGLFTGISLIALSSFISTDVILMKHFFSPTQAGEYAVLSLIGRIVFYITSPVSTVLFPLLVSRYEKGENITRLLIMACGLVFLPSLVLVIIYAVAPQLVIEVISGKSSYFVIAPYLPWYGMYIALYCIANILIIFLLAIRKTAVAYFAGLAALLQIGLLILFHANFSEVVTVSIIAMSCLCLCVLLLSFRVRKSV